MVSHLGKIPGSLWTKMLDKVVVPWLPARYANLVQSSKVGLWNRYFEAAEESMQTQWDDIIWPIIGSFDFDTVLELAPGAGRNTEKLCAISRTIHAVEYNAYALTQCRSRLGARFKDCDIEYHVNQGSDLEMIDDGSISMVYCWDAAVHFDKSVLDDYIREFARVMKPGARGFVHHSNLGDKASKNIKRNTGWRSNMGKEHFAETCETNGLQIVAQIDIPWGTITDCGSVFEKSPETTTRS